jgi:single-strand DNA-binding protein
MKTLNKVELMGYVGNPEVVIMKNGTELLKCSLATHESFKTKVGNWETETTWHRIIFWNNKTDQKSPEIKKGDRLKVDGKLFVSQYTDKDGVKRSSILVRANSLDVVPKEADVVEIPEGVEEKVF